MIDVPGNRLTAHQVRITRLDERRFTHGDCHYLARAIYRRTGWPIFCFVAPDGQPRLHAFNRQPDGRNLDVRGPQTEAELRSAWRQPNAAIAAFSEDEIGRAPTTDGRPAWTPRHGPYSLKRAKQLAVALAQTDL